MNFADIQTLIILLSVFFLGLTIGWWVRMLYHNTTKQTFSQELTQLRETHRMTRQAHEKTQQELAKLKKMYELLLQQKQQLTHALHQELYHADYLRVRKQLEEARKELDHSQAEVQKRERHIVRLVDLARTLKKQLPHPQSSESDELLDTTHLSQLSNLLEHSDNLEQIDGINSDIARKLQQLGISRYRQLAECTPTQLAQIKSLLGIDQEFAIKEWVLLAKQLVLTPLQAEKSLRQAS